jgi:flagellum-specific peptidoglycan hydrolase FlgJ
VGVICVSVIYAYQPEEFTQEASSFTLKQYKVEDDQVTQDKKLDVAALIAMFAEEDLPATELDEDEESTSAENVSEAVEADEVVTYASEEAPEVNLPAFSGDPEEFIEFMVPYAQKIWDDYKILPSLTIAQCIIESGYGKKAIGWNLSGTKACCQNGGIHDTFIYYIGNEMQVAGTCDKHADRKKTKLWTHEGAEASVNTQKWFAYYETSDEFMQARYNVLSQERYYPGLIGETDYIKATEKVRRYATNEEYVDSLRSIINEHSLMAYDPVSE